MDYLKSKIYSRRVLPDEDSKGASGVNLAYSNALSTDVIKFSVSAD